MTTGEVTNKVVERRTAWKVVIPRSTWSFVRLPLPRHWLLLTECAAGVWLESLRPVARPFCDSASFTRSGVSGIAAYWQTLHFDRAVSRRSTGRGATDPELMIGRSDPRLLFVEHQHVLGLLTLRCGPFGFHGQR